MSSSTSPSKLKFLFDENVDMRLKRFLEKQGVDIILNPKGVSNGKLAEFSKSEQRILVTNDKDFVEFSGPFFIVTTVASANAFMSSGSSDHAPRSPPR